MGNEGLLRQIENRRTKIKNSQKCLFRAFAGSLRPRKNLYVDNFYTSYKLALCLLAKQIHVIGTLRAKKGISKEVLDTKLRNGEVISQEDENGVVVLKRRNTCDARMFSTKHAPTMEPADLQQGQASAPGQQVITLTNQPSTSTAQDQPQSSNRRRRSKKPQKNHYQLSLATKQKQELTCPIRWLSM